MLFKMVKEALPEMTACTPAVNINSWLCHGPGGSSKIKTKLIDSCSQNTNSRPQYHDHEPIREIAKSNNDWIIKLIPESECS